MINAVNNLVQEWQPAPRPDWVQRINLEASHLNIHSLVPLDADYLIKTARRNTGLDDFGPDDWIEPFRVLTHAIETESNLNLVGRLMTGEDLLANLEARLRVEQMYDAHPEIEQERIVKPLFILGQPRTGTSALQNILASAADMGTIRTWEAWFPAPFDESDTDDELRRIQRAVELTGMWNRVTPELVVQHEINAHIPTECNLIHGLAFRSRTMVHLGQIPSYDAYMAKASIAPALKYHERILKLLQWKNKSIRWILKSPDYITMIPEVLAQYPDAAFVFTHRDPVKAFASGVNLIGTLQWMRSDTVFRYESSDSHVVNRDNIAALMNFIVQMLEDGTIPKSKFLHVLYGDIVKDPLGVVARIDQQFGFATSDCARQQMQRFVEENNANRQGHRHVYETGDAEDIARARRSFRTYQEYFGIPNEL